MWRKLKAFFVAPFTRQPGVSQAGMVNIGNILMLGISLIFIAVGLIMFPVVLDGVTEILEASSIDDYTGLEEVAEVSPLIVLIGFVAAGIVTGFFGIKNIIKG